MLQLTARSQNKQDMLIVPVLMPHERSRASIVNIGVGHEECSEAKGPLQGTKMSSLANFLLQRISLSAVSMLKQALFVHKSMVLVFAVVYHDYAGRAARQIQTLICCASAKEVLVCEKGRCNFCDKKCHPAFGVVLELVLCFRVVPGSNLR